MTADTQAQQQALLQALQTVVDPNTGKDFVYSDDFKNNIENYQQLMGWRDVDGERVSSLASRKNTEASGRFHTDWLNMIYPRLSRLLKYYPYGRTCSAAASAFVAAVSVF